MVICTDGMIGQVSPEAFFSRLQTEGKKTEAESEVSAQLFKYTVYFTCLIPSPEMTVAICFSLAPLSGPL